MSGETVLLVDDQDADLMSLQRAVAPLKLTTLTAHTGEEAIARMKASDVALVLMDVRMPGLSGFETAEIIRAQEPAKRVPIIFVSSTAREEALLVKAYASGAVDYLAKPVDGETLRERVQVVLRLRREMRELEQERQSMKERAERASDAERREAERFRTLTRILNTIVWTKDAQGRAVEDSPAWRAFTGQSETERSGFGWKDAIHPDDRAKCEEAWRAAIAGKKSYQADYRLRRHDGAYVPFSVRGAAVLDAAGEVQEWVGASMDMSERERVESQLRQAVAMREEFLSVAAHELNTPLTPLTLRAELLRGELQQPRDAASERRLAAHVDGARRQIERLATLVRGLMDTTRISGGRLVLRRTDDVNLAAIVRDVAAGLEPQAAAQHCALELEAPARVLGRWDALRLEQVATNLMTNALKFGAGHPVHVQVEETNSGARLTVRDEGIGMTPEVRARIFGRFERGVSDRHYGGLGLGLYITNELVAALGGSIRVESTPGHGAIFTVDLPRGASDAESDSPEMEDGGERSKTN